MRSETASRGSILGVAGLCSLCCAGSGTLVIAGGGVAGSAVGSGHGIGFSTIVATVLTLTIVGLVVRHRRGCRPCGA